MPCCYLFMIAVTDALTKPQEDSNLRSFGNSQGTISENSEPEVVEVDGCTPSSKGYTLCPFQFQFMGCHNMGCIVSSRGLDRSNSWVAIISLSPSLSCWLLYTTYHDMTVLFCSIPVTIVFKLGILWSFSSEWITFHPNSESEAEPFHCPKDFYWQWDSWWKDGSYSIWYYLFYF